MRLVLRDVVQNGREKDRRVESLRQFRVQVRGEDASGGKHRLGRPVPRLGNPENLEVRADKEPNFLPIGQRWDDFESFGEFPGSITRL